MAYDPELEAFKTEIDLRDYLAALDFEHDRKKGARSSSSWLMRRGDEKIVITRGLDGHYLYFAVGGKQDSGSIIDFIQNRTGKNIGQVRKELRPWLHRPPVPIPAFPPLKKSAKDRGLVEAAFAGMAEALHHPYLVNERGLSPAPLGSRRFAGCVRIDERRNAIFAHVDINGELCGYEVKNRAFTGFAKGGEKGVWCSQDFEDDNRLVFAEVAIDALSYAELFPDERARYRSIGGELNPKQPALIKAEIGRMPDGAEVVAAFDADDTGRKYGELVRLAVEGVARETGKALTYRLDLPATVGADWNDVLKERRTPSFPTAQTLQNE